MNSEIYNRATFTKRPLPDPPIYENVLPTIAALTDHEKRRYSLTNLINVVSEYGMKHRLNAHADKEHCLETEISASLTKDLGPCPHGGTWVPLRIKAAGQDMKTNAGGGYTTTTVLGDIVDSLRKQTKVLSLGAQLLTGIKQMISFPTENSLISGSWVAENPGSDVAESNAVFGVLNTSGKMYSATNSFSRKLLAQSSVDVEAWITSRIAKAHALAFDLAAIHGPGTQDQPTGLLNTSGVTIVPVGTDGGAPTSDLINSLEAAVGAANADSASCAFLTNSTMRSKLRKIPAIASGTAPLWSGNTMLGYRSEVSNQVRSDLTKGSSSDCSAVIFGAWENLVICEFSAAFEVLIDGFARKKAGMVELTSWSLVDIAVTAPSAFSASLDMRNI